MANLVTAAELKTAYPEFSGVEVPVIDDWIGRADEEINADAWGTRGKKAEMALACHLMTMAGVGQTTQTGAGQAAGPISSIKVGEVSVGYANTAAIAVQVSGLDPSLANTRYGLEYARLIKTMAYGAEVV